MVRVEGSRAQAQGCDKESSSSAGESLAFYLPSERVHAGLEWWEVRKNVAYHWQLEDVGLLWNSHVTWGQVAAPLRSPVFPSLLEDWLCVVRGLAMSSEVS